MKQITKEELKNILKDHARWLNNVGGKRADLSHTDLRNTNLKNADLRYAILTKTDLRFADLQNAKLKQADMKNVNLSNADLRGADMRAANLEYSDMAEADLSYANLGNAILRYANFDSANLKNANLGYATLRNSNLFIPYACPDTGSFVGFKKANGYIVKLEILEDSKRLSGTDRICRCDKAKVLSIENLDGSISDITMINSNYDKNFTYVVGDIISVPDFCKNRWVDGSGIHFFITRKEAVRYGFI